MKRNPLVSVPLFLLGLAALSPAPPVISTEPPPPYNLSTSCSAAAPACTSYLKWISTIDPYCCGESATSCMNYKIEVWQCAAGATRYNNFAASSGSAGAPCHQNTGCG